MWLRRLSIKNLRIIAHADIVPGPCINMLFGFNGSGKTSVLEGLYMLGTGRSFRSRLIREVIRRGEDKVVVFGELTNSRGGRLSVGVERGPAKTHIRVDGEDVRVASQLARTVPALLITPDSQRLLYDGARLRRRMLDWAMFHVEPDYAGLLQRYRRALRQRNAALRQQSTSAMEGFDGELAATGRTIDQKREAYLSSISALVTRRVAELLGGLSVSVGYARGWDPDSDLEQVLHKGLASDRLRGFTQSGPHRADLDFRVDERQAQTVLSRGEGKLMVVGLLLAQVEAIRARGVEPVVLVDDLAAELDQFSRSRLLGYLAESGGQTFVTALTEEQLESLPDGSATVFHVEQGNVQKMV